VASKYRIELSETEERELRRRAGQYTRSHREELRAKIVLLASEGHSNADRERNALGVVFDLGRAHGRQATSHGLRRFWDKISGQNANFTGFRGKEKRWFTRAFS
jgi:hypothetical protein